MKKIWFVICFLALTDSVFGQQVVWSTVRGTDTRYVPLNDVTNEVMNFYDQHDYYYDFTGFNKDTFIRTFDDGTGGWDWIYSINDKTVIAARIYIEGGSAVYVVCVDKQGVDMVAFSNVYDSGNNITSPNRRARFENWFKALLK
jgi:hypothetical protein